MLGRRLILNVIFWYITSLCMQILSQNNSITISETFKASFAFHAVVDTSVVSASSVVESDWSTFRRVHCAVISHQQRLRSIKTVAKIYQPRKKMRRNIMAGNQYSKLVQGDEEIACQFVRRENHSHENDAKRRLITACVFCTVFIICEVIGK